MTTDKCFSCKRKGKSLLCTICGIGINGEREYYTRKPITNADRIRAMTDEDLAKYLAWLTDEQACYGWKLYGDADRITKCLDLLKKEAK